MTTPNNGRFRKGHDPRRHKFTTEECQAGFQAALVSIITRYPDAVDKANIHMATRFLKKGRNRNDRDRNR